MRYRITFAAGLAIGYVLGTKAGRARYEQITRTARRFVENPALQETAGLVGGQVGNAGKAAYSKVNEKLPVTSMRDFLARPSPEENAELDHGGPNGAGPDGFRRRGPVPA